MSVMASFSLADNFLEVSNALQVLDIRSYSSMNIMLPPILLENLNNLKTLCLSGEWLSRYCDYMLNINDVSLCYH